MFYNQINIANDFTSIVDCIYFACYSIPNATFACEEVS